MLTLLAADAVRAALARDDRRRVAEVPPAHASGGLRSSQHQRAHEVQRQLARSERWRGEEAQAALVRASRRLERLCLYPRPLRLDRVRLVTLPAFFRLPWFRRYQGYALWRTILLRRAPGDVSDDLLTHELCHIWQMQHRPLHMLLTYLATRYADNPYEREARRAVAETRGR